MFLNGLSAEIIILVITIILISHSYKKNGLKFTFVFFTVLFCGALLVEELCILNNLFFYTNHNFYIMDVPVAIILYWSLFYVLLSFYEWLMKKKVNLLFGLVTHFSIDAFVTTPLYIIAGLWVVSGTLFPTYPYFSPILHTLEAVAGLLLSLLFIHLKRKLVKQYS